MYNDNKLFHYTMEYYSQVKKNEIKIFTGKWIELETIILSQVIQLRKTNITYSLLHVDSTVKSLGMCIQI